MFSATKKTGGVETRLLVCGVLEIPAKVPSETPLFLRLYLPVIRVLWPAFLAFVCLLECIPPRYELIEVVQR